MSCNMASQSAFEVGQRFISSSGHIWTLQRIHKKGRFFLTKPSPAGDNGMMIDLDALHRMVAIGHPETLPVAAARRLASHQPTAEQDPASDRSHAP